MLDTRDFLVLDPVSTTEVRIPSAGGAVRSGAQHHHHRLDQGVLDRVPRQLDAAPAANLNSLYPFHTVANQVIVPLDDEGDFNVFRKAADTSWSTSWA